MGAPAPLTTTTTELMRHLNPGDRIGTSQGPVTVLAVRRDPARGAVDVQFDDGQGYRPYRWDDEAHLIVPSSYSRACPNCQAPIGELCTQPTDTGRVPVSWVHLTRVPLRDDA